MDQEVQKRRNNKIAELWEIYDDMSKPADTSEPVQPAQPAQPAQQTPVEPLKAGLAAHWKFDEIKDNVTANATGDKFKGTVLSVTSGEGKLGKSGVTRDIPVIFVSNRDGEADRAWGLKQGATDYVTKPVDPGTLLSAISAAVAMAA